jgi:hypothetical protein
MKKLFTLVACACMSSMLVSAGEPVTSIVLANTENSYLDCGVNSMYSNNQEMTLETWVKYNEGTSNSGYMICNESDEPEPAKASGYVLRSNSGQVELCIGNSSWNSVRSNTTLQQDGTWHHVAATISATEIKMYIDGQWENTTALTAPMNPSAQSLNIGEGTAWKGRRMIGQLADVRIWAVVRTDEEIAAKKDAGALTGKEPGLLANWKMKEGAGTTIHDATGQNNLTMGAEVTWDGVVDAIKGAAVANVDVLVKGKTLSVVNGAASTLNVSVFNLAGSKVLATSVKAGDTFDSELASGVYIVKGTDEAGAQIISKIAL